MLEFTFCNTIRPVLLSPFLRINFSERPRFRGFINLATRHFTHKSSGCSARSRYMMAPKSVLIYIMRRDLRLEDNPIFSALAEKSASEMYTHLLPVYVFAAQQLEVSGFVSESSSKKNPYPEARSPVGNFWRCGPHRAKFLGECVSDLKSQLESVGSGLLIRVGMVDEVVQNLISGFSENSDTKVGGVWMTNEEGVEEKREEKAVKNVCQKQGVNFRLFGDEKYFIDDRDVPFNEAKDLPDVFTTYRKMVEPLREAPRPVLPKPKSLPPLPEASSIPSQHQPFSIPDTPKELQRALLSPISLSTIIQQAPPPCDTPSAHPFQGGSSTGHERINHLLASGSMTAYKATRNGLLGTDFSTKLSAWLALGCITSRQIHAALISLENGDAAALPSGHDWPSVEGFGKGENEGTKAVRFELLWRDYMRLCTRKFGPKLFRLSGFREDDGAKWRYPSQDPEAARIFERLLAGKTGMGLIDASQRELFLTGYTSNRARQNVASFLAKHLNIDWRLGAEWYESMLVDYDVSSNWGNWQYVSGVGNDPRGEARVFNPVKQAWDYDANGEYVLAWIPELQEANTKIAEGLRPNEIFQAWEIPEQKRKDLGLEGVEWVERPLKRINFTVGKKAPNRNGRGGGRGSYRGNSEKTGGEKGMGRSGGQSRGGYGGSGYGSGGGGGYNGRGYKGQPRRGGWQNGSGGGGREARVGMMEKAVQAGEYYEQ